MLHVPFKELQKLFLNTHPQIHQGPDSPGFLSAPALYKYYQHFTVVSLFQIYTGILQLNPTDNCSSWNNLMWYSYFSLSNGTDDKLHRFWEHVHADLQVCFNSFAFANYVFIQIDEIHLIACSKCILISELWPQVCQ